MSQPATEFEGASMEPHNNPPIKAVGVEPAGSGETPRRYPDYEFKLEEQRFIVGAYEVTDSQRLRVAAKTLADKVPAYRDLSSPNERKRIQEKKNAYLKERVYTVVDGKKQRQTKRQLVDTDSAVDTVFYGMAEVNHPTAQLIGQIADKFEDKLHPRQLGWLYSQLVTLTGWDEMKQVYDRQLADSEQTVVE